jgi:hypothetical protein
MPRSPWRRIRLASIAAGLMAKSIRLDQIRHRQLNTSHGCQDHTVLPYATPVFVKRLRRTQVQVRRSFGEAEASFVCALLFTHGKAALRTRFTPTLLRPPHPTPRP